MYFSPELLEVKSIIYVLDTGQGLLKYFNFLSGMGRTIIESLHGKNVVKSFDIFIRVYV